MTNLSFEQLPIAVTQLSKQIENIEKMLLKHYEERPTNQPEKHLTVDEAATYLSLAIPTIYSKVSKRELPFMKRGKRLYFSRLELSDYLKGGKRETNTNILSDGAKFLSKKGRG